MERYIRPTKEEDVPFIAQNMRTQDIEECEAGGYTALDALSMSVQSSQICYTLMDSHQVPMAIVGASQSLYSNAGIIWLLGTDLIEKNSFKFLRHSRSVLDRLYSEMNVEVMHNSVYHGNKLHIKWLKWLGFHFLNTVLIGPNQSKFIEFARLRG